ncbi:unnamed protein product [Closterium sp. Yama58-4]|nr:unnamed protein product [Closterium sp. Yama58-4]
MVPRPNSYTWCQISVTTKFYYSLRHRVTDNSLRLFLFSLYPRLPKPQRGPFARQGQLPSSGHHGRHPPCESRFPLLASPRTRLSGHSPLRALISPRPHLSAPSSLRALISPRPHLSAPSSLRALISPRPHLSARSSLRALISPRPHLSALSPHRPALLASLSPLPRFSHRLSSYLLLPSRLFFLVPALPFPPSHAPSILALPPSPCPPTTLPPSVPRSSSLPAPSVGPPHAFLLPRFSDAFSSRPSPPAPLHPPIPAGLFFPLLPSLPSSLPPPLCSSPSPPPLLSPSVLPSPVRVMMPPVRAMVCHVSGMQPQAEGPKYAHPQVVFFTCFFKAAALGFYLLGSWFTSSFVIDFVVCVLLIALDFWVVKNVSGRILVGLRWWNETDESGETLWHFESLDQASLDQLSKTDAWVFWWTLYCTPGLWLGLGLIQVIRLSFDYLLIIIVALVLGAANIYGYTKCRRDAKKQIQQFAAQTMAQNFASTLTSALAV